VRPKQNRPSGSIGLRLTLATAALLFTAFAVVVGVAYLATLEGYDTEVANYVETEIAELMTMYTRDGSRELVREVRKRARSADGRYTVYLFQQSNGRMAGNLERWPEGVGDSAELSNISMDEAPGDYRVLRQLRVRSLTVGSDRLLVGRDITDRSTFKNSLRIGSLVALGIAILLTIGAGLAISRNVLGRIQGMNQTIVRIREGAGEERVPLSARGDEFDQLAVQFNELVEENRRLVEVTREVTNNIAHDLRTPLARMRASVESALAEQRRGQTHDDPHEGPHDLSRIDDALHAVLAETDSLLETFNGLLQLSQVESGALRDTMEDVSLEDIAQAAIELYEPLAEEAGLELVAELRPGLTVHANRHLLAQALTNLIDNAIKYGRVGGTIDVQTDRSSGDTSVDGHPRLIVRDRGPGIPAADRDRVLLRFTRLDDSRTQPGTGLGLSFVAAVAELHDAELALDDAAPGLRITITFPR